MGKRKDGTVNTVSEDHKLLEKAMDRERWISRRAYVLVEEWFKDHQETLQMAIELCPGSYEVPTIGSARGYRAAFIVGEIRRETTKAARTVAEYEDAVSERGIDWAEKMTKRGYSGKMPEFDDKAFKIFADRIKSRNAIADRGKTKGWKALRPMAPEI